MSRLCVVTTRDADVLVVLRGSQAHTPPTYYEHDVARGAFAVRRLEALEVFLVCHRYRREQHKLHARVHAHAKTRTKVGERVGLGVGVGVRVGVGVGAGDVPMGRKQARKHVQQAEISHARCGHARCTHACAPTRGTHLSFLDPPEPPLRLE